MPRTRYTWRRHKEAQGQAVANCTPSSWDNGEFYPLSSGQLPDESNFNQCIPFIGEMDVAQVQAMVKLACIVPVQAAKAAAVAAGKEGLSMQAMVEAYQIKERVVERALLAIFGYKSIKPIQLRVIVRQLPGAIPRDTLLVAKTGFGKSMTFQAFAPLTGMIAIQVIPLSKLGEEQAAQMSRLPGAKPVVITAETKLANPHLYREIREGKYNHILIGPEQLLTPEFRNVLKSIHNRVGLLAIDEVHLVEMWGQGFRQLFTSICETRRLLPKTVTWYGCTATLNETQERAVRMYGGFRDDLLVIRTSIDRPELRIIIRPIMKGDARTYSPLFFLLHGAVSIPGEEGDPVDFGHVVPGITKTWQRDIEHFRARRLQLAQSGLLVLSPRRIPKTIVYIDGTKLVCTVADCLRTWLLDLGYTIREAADVVSSFSSYTSDHDKGRILTAFAKESSTRILVATNAVGMGMDIRDIDIVVQWGFPLGYQVADLWQRWGRAARDPERSGTLVLFCPYWAHDSQGFEPGVSEKASGAQSKGRGSGIMRAHGGGRVGPKRVRFVLTPDDADTDSNDDILPEGDQYDWDSTFESSEGDRHDGDSTLGPEESTQQSDDSAQAGGGKDTSRQGKEKRRKLTNHDDVDSLGRRPWNADEIRRRAELDEPWLELVNAPCIRSFILHLLGEGLAEKEVVTSDHLNSSNEEKAFWQSLDDGIATAASQEKGSSSTQDCTKRIVCCSGSECSPQLAKEHWDTCPGAPKRLRKPRKASLAGHLLEDINAWVQSTIEEKYGDVMGMSEDAIMDSQTRIAIANRLGANDGRRRRSKILATEEAFYCEDALSAWGKQLEDPATAWEQDERLFLKRSLYNAACSWKSWDAKAYVDEVDQQLSSEEDSLRSQTFTRNAAKVANQTRERIRDLTQKASDSAEGSMYTLIQEELALARREFDVVMSAETELERVDQIEKSATISGSSTRRRRGRPRKRGGGNNVGLAAVGESAAAAGMSSFVTAGMPSSPITEIETRPASDVVGGTSKCKPTTPGSGRRGKKPKQPRRGSSSSSDTASSLPLVIRSVSRSGRHRQPTEKAQDYADVQRILKQQE